MKKVLVPMLAASAALAGVLTSGESASATAITVGPYSSSYGPEVTDYSVPDALSVPQVNPLDYEGTPALSPDPVLSQVMKKLNGSLFGTVTVANTTNVTQSVSQLGVLGTIEATGDGHTLTTSPFQTFVSTGDTWLPGETSVYTVNAMAMITEDLFCTDAGGADDCSAWIGDGSVFKDLEAKAEQFVIGSANLEIEFNTTAQADFEVTYLVHDKDGKDTPEPSALLGLGVLGLGGLTRKMASRRKNSNSEFN